MGGKGGGGPSYTPPPTTDNSDMMQAMLDQQAAQNQDMMNMFMEMMNSQTPVTQPAIEPTNPTKPTDEDLAFIQPIEDIKKEAEKQTPEGTTPVTSKPILDQENPVTTMLKSLLTSDEDEETTTSI